MIPFWRLVRLLAIAVVIGFGLAYAALWGIIGAVLVLAAIVGSIALHELGHLLVARALGVKATEYFVGLGPRVWARTRGELTYGVKLLPLGGHCTIIGMTGSSEVDPADEHRAFRSQRPWVQAAIALAGPAVNLAIAAVLLFGADVAGGTGTRDAVRALPADYHELSVVSAQGLVDIPGNLPDMVSAAVSGADVDDPNARVLSPVGAARLADQAVDAGLPNALGMVALVNLFVALFNLVPLPPLDGGHTILAAGSAVLSRLRGHRVAFDPKHFEPLTLAVVATLAVLGLSSLVLDVSHPIANPF